MQPGSCTDLVGGLELGKYFKSPKIPDSGRQILIESTVLDVEYKSSNKTWGLPSKSKFSMRLTRERDKFAFLKSGGLELGFG